MEYTQIEHDKDAEIVPFIGIQRKWANATLKLYSFIFLGYTIWVVFQEFGDATKTLQGKLAFLVPHLGAFSVFEAVTIIAVIQIWDVIMYLTNRFKANIENIRVTSEARGIAKGKVEGRAEGIAEGKVEGRAEARAEANQVFSDWYQRLESAKARGAPFDEPPPFLKGDKTEE